jgi:hypothetical protein
LASDAASIIFFCYNSTTFFTYYNPNFWLRILAKRNIPMNVIWRFYMDDGQRWNWQQIGAGQAVVEASSKGYGNYEACLANAKDRGYVFLPAQTKQAPGR